MIDQEKIVSKENSVFKINKENKSNLEIKTAENPIKFYGKVLENSKIGNSVRSSIENMSPFIKNNPSHRNNNQQTILQNQKLQRQNSFNYEGNFPYPPSQTQADLALLSPISNHPPLNGLFKGKSPREKRLSLNNIQHKIVQQPLSIQTTQSLQQKRQQQQYFDKLRLVIMSPKHNKFETLNNKSSNNSELYVNTNHSISAFRLDTLTNNKLTETSKNDDIENKHSFVNKSIKNGKMGYYINPVAEINNAYSTKSKPGTNIGDFSFNDPSSPDIQHSREISPKSRFSQNSQNTLHNQNLMDDKQRLNKVKNFRNVTRNNSAPLIEMEKCPDEYKYENINAFRGQMVLNSSNQQKDKIKRKVIMINKALGSKFASCKDNQSCNNNNIIKSPLNEIKNNKDYKVGQFFNNDQRLMQQTSYFPNIPQ